MADTKLMLGDCLELMKALPDGSVDAVITDPPYGVRERTTYASNGRSRAAACQDFRPVYGDDKPFDPLPWLDYPVVVLFGANHYASRLPDSPCWLVWDKRCGGQPDDNADCEMAYTNLNKPARMYRHLWRGMIKDSERGVPKYHPTQKPIALMRWCIELVTQPGDTVLDPFMGSGTTGVACMQLGRNFIGMEIDPTYFAVAQKRIEAARAQLHLEYDDGRH